MKKLMLFLVIAMLASNGGAVASAATIVYVGEDVTTNDQWRTTDHAKPLDIDGDNVYGTDGYFIGITLAGVDASPAYAPVTRLAGSADAEQVHQAYFDDPALTGLGPVPDIRCGDWWVEPPPTPDLDFFSILLTEDAAFRLGVLADQTRYDGNPGHDVLYESPMEVRVRESGGPADSGWIDTLGPGEAWRNADVDYFFFDVSGQAGDVFIVSGLNDLRWEALGMAGVTFDGAEDFDPNGPQAYDPQPADDSSTARICDLLQWRGQASGVGYGLPIEHQVYFGTDEATVRDATVPDGTGTPDTDPTYVSYDPGTLLYGTEYFWRIDEKYDTGSGEYIMKGGVWRFETASYEDGYMYYERADANNDCSVDLDDLVEWALKWMTCEDPGNPACSP